MTVGQRIKALRKGQDMTQEELAQKLGITKSAVCRVERDKEQNLTLDRVERYAEALGTTPKKLMGLDVKEMVSNEKDVAIDIYDKLDVIIHNTSTRDTIKKMIEYAIKLEEGD